MRRGGEKKGDVTGFILRDLYCGETVSLGWAVDITTSPSIS
jgi:hypothetical protein